MVASDGDLRGRRSVRLRGYDYTQFGSYFVTICAANQRCLFGRVWNGQMRLNGSGHIVRDEWLRTISPRPSLELDEYVVMPNHFHAVFHICGDGVGTVRDDPVEDAAVGAAHGAMEHAQVGTARCTPTFQRPAAGSVAAIVRAFKSAVTKRFNERPGSPGHGVWQRGYYEHVIRNETELGRVRDYIRHNPERWEEDHENPRRDRAALQARDERPWLRGVK